MGWFRKSLNTVGEFLGSGTETILDAGREFGETLNGDQSFGQGLIDTASSAAANTADIWDTWTENDSSAAAYDWAQDTLGGTNQGKHVGNYSEDGSAKADSPENDPASSVNLDPVMDAISEVSQALDDNKTRTTYDENGAPIVQQWDPETETWVTRRDYSDAYASLENLMNQEFTSFDEFTGGEYDDTMQQYNDLLSRIESGPSEADRQEAMAWAAELMGFDSAADYQNRMGGLQQQINSGIGNQQGFSDEERRARQDMINRNAATQERQMERQLDAIAASGQSTMQYLKAADGARAQIADQRAAQEVGMMQEEFQRKSMQYQAKTQEYGMLLESGQINANQYMEGLRADRMGALQGYAQEMSLMLEQYGTETQAMAQHAQTIYEAINSQVGIGQAAIDEADALLEQAMSGPMSELQTQLLGLETSISAEMAGESGEDGLSDVLGTIQPIIQMVAMFL
jgi:hypothetical protein